MKNKLNEDFFKEFSSPYKFKKNKLIISPETEPPGVFFVKSGFVRQYLISKNGKEITVNILNKNTYFPIIWAHNFVPNIYFYETLSDTTLLQAPRKKIAEQLKKHPEMLTDLLRRILNGLEGTTKTMENLISGNAHDQINSTLMMLVLRFGKKTNNYITIHIPLTHRIIATLAGLSRESTSLELGRLAKDNVIDKIGKYIVVKNLKKLQEES